MFLLGALKELADHSRIPWRFGVLHKIVVSPVFHSFHHSVDPAHHNKNFSGLLSVWDHLFGTAVIDDSAGPSRFGLETVRQTTLAGTVLDPFRLLHGFYFAKVARDALMVEMCAQYHGYGFCRHKGYPTPEHKMLLQRRGPCPIHRRSFAPVAQFNLPW